MNSNYRIIREAEETLVDVTPQPGSDTITEIVGPGYDVQDSEELKNQIAEKADVSEILIIVAAIVLIVGLGVLIYFMKFRNKSTEPQAEATAGAVVEETNTEETTKLKTDTAES